MRMIARNAILLLSLVATGLFAKALYSPTDLDHFQKTGECVGCNLISTEIYNDKIKVNLEGAFLIKSMLQGSFKQANFKNAMLMYATTPLILFNAIDASDSDFTSANLSDVIFKYVNFNHSNFTNAILTSANFNGAKLSNSQFGEATLVLGNFAEAKLTNSNFHHANLMGANFKSATLSSCDFTDANVADVNFENANLMGAKITSEQLKQAKTIDCAILPDGTVYQGDRSSPCY